MQRSGLLVLSLALVLVCAVSAAPSKPVWPTNFSTPFGLMLTNPPLFNSTAMFYSRFDSTLKAQRIQYLANCINLGGDSVKYPCDIFFNSQGTYLFQPGTAFKCCLAFPGIGPVPTDFLSPFTFADVETAPDYYGRVHKCNRWTGPDDFGYWTDATTGFDVKFKDGDTGTFWNFGDFTVKTQDPSIFQLPPTDCSQSCGLSGTVKENGEWTHPLLQDPFVRLAMTHAMMEN